MESLTELLTTLLGRDQDELSVAQMCVRSFLAYSVLIVGLNIGHKKLLGKLSGLDYLLIIIIGSVVSRAINGSAPFFPTLAVSLFLFGLHWFLSLVVFHFPQLSSLFKDRSRYLIENGKLVEKELRASHVTEDEILMEMRLRMGKEDLNGIQTAILERNGNISFIPNSETASKF